MFLGFDGLVQAIGIAAAYHQAAGELIHDDDFVILHHIVDITLHQHIGLQRLDEIVVQLVVLGIRQVFDPKRGFSLCGAVFSKNNAFFLLLHRIVGLVFQARDEAVGLFIHICRLVALAGNDQRGARFINQDGVNLVNHGIVMSALHHIAAVDHHVVAQIIKAHLVIRAVGDIAGIRHAPLFSAQIMDDDANAHPQKTEQLPHLFALELCQVVVDRDDVNTLAA